MALLNFRKSEPAGRRNLSDILDGASIEVMPRTVGKVENFGDRLPKGTRVYLAHIDGTEFDDMVATADRLVRDGYAVMPHIPARSIPDRAALEDLVGRYRALGIDQALLLAGGRADPAGDYLSSLDLLETGLFDDFARIHVAGHPEGNRDIEGEGEYAIVDDALAQKQAWSQRTGVEMAIATQFAFESEPVIVWIERLRAAGITLPVHAGVAGPTKLQTLIKYAMACGVGPSIRVLQKRGMDLSKLMLPYKPDQVLAELQDWRAAHPDMGLERVHVFPLGGIVASTDWLAEER